MSTAYHLFDALTPSVTDSNDGDLSLTLGTEWYADAEGIVRGVRFYLGSRNYDTATVVGGLYDAATATLIAQKSRVITSGDAIGFVDITFTTPVLVHRNQTYMAAVWFPGSDAPSPDGKTHYTLTPYLLQDAFDKAPLHTYKNDPLFLQYANGAFNHGTSISFPSSTFHSSCYFIDVWYEYIAQAQTSASGDWGTHPIKHRSGGQWQY